MQNSYHGILSHEEILDRKKTCEEQGLCFVTLKKFKEITEGQDDSVMEWHSVAQEVLVHKSVVGIKE